MKKEVKIQVKGLQRDEEAEEKVETAAFGECDITGEGCCLKYDEISEDGNVTKTLIRITKERIEVIKRGAIESEMIFVPGTVTETKYNTCYGVLDMAVDTAHAEYEMMEEGIRAEIGYVLYLNGSRISVNLLNITAVFL